MADCGIPAGVTISDLSDALSRLNENFVDCDTNLGCLAFAGTAPKRSVDGGVSQAPTKDIAPRTTILSQDTPNPFNPRTQISFSLAHPGVPGRPVPGRSSLYW